MCFFFLFVFFLFFVFFVLFFVVFFNILSIGKQFICKDERLNVLIIAYGSERVKEKYFDRCFYNSSLGGYLGFQI